MELRLLLDLGELRRLLGKGSHTLEADLCAKIRCGRRWLGALVIVDRLISHWTLGLGRVSCPLYLNMLVRGVKLHVETDMVLKVRIRVFLELLKLKMIFV